MENNVIEQVSIIENDFTSNQNLYDNNLHDVYYKKKSVIPLYIGKTETYGKSNLKNFFARWEMVMPTIEI